MRRRHSRDGIDQRRRVVRPIANATAVISGCPQLPKDGNTLVYRLRFADGAEADLGTWNPLTRGRLAALEAIAAQLPAGVIRVRFANPIGSAPLSAECLKAFGHKWGADGVARLLRLLAVSNVEKNGLAGLLWEQLL
jgi:hypothetical protein